jgi:hypothetical protein
MTFSTTKGLMHIAAQKLLNRLSEVERCLIRRATSEDAINGLYNDFKPELPGGHLYGGTVEEGRQAMREVHAAVGAKFAIDSKKNTFGHD